MTDDGLVGGDSSSGGEDEDEDDAEARIYAELLEEQAAKKRSAALEGLNEINTGQAGWDGLPHAIISYVTAVQCGAVL